MVAVPAMSLLVAAGLIASDAQQTASRSEATAHLAELTMRAAAVDSALGAESVAAASSFDGYRTAQAAAETDLRLHALRRYVAAQGQTNRPVDQAIAVIDETLRFRDDVDTGIISPLQIADRYGAARRILRSAISTEARVNSPDQQMVDVSAMLALVNASSAQVDERLSVWLAIRYDTWAPGQLAVAISAIERQRTHLTDAGTLIDGFDVKPPAALVDVRSSVVQSSDAPPVGIEEWNRLSDRWSDQLDAAIDRHVSQVVGDARTSAAEARRSFGLTVLIAIVLLVLAVGMAVRIARLRHRELLDLEHRASHDALTGLPNREFLLRHLQDVCARADAMAPPGILFLDLDGFKPINDVLGHERGDQVLCEVGQRLQQAIGSTPAVVGRLGGDEFVVVVEAIRTERSVFRIASSCRSAVRSIETPKDLALDVSVGVAVHRPGMTHDELLCAADDAMYAAKGTTSRLRVASLDGSKLLDDQREDREASFPVVQSAFPDADQKVVRPS